MESHSYLADKLSYYRLPFLSKSTALKVLNFGEMRQQWYPGAEEASFSPFLLLLPSSSHSLKSNLIPLPVYPVNKRDEEEERKSSRGSRVVLTLSFRFTGFHDKLQKLGANKDVMITAAYSGCETYKSHVAHGHPNITHKLIQKKAMQMLTHVQTHQSFSKLHLCVTKYLKKNPIRMRQGQGR